MIKQTQSLFYLIFFVSINLFGRVLPNDVVWNESETGYFTLKNNNKDSLLKDEPITGIVNLNSIKSNNLNVKIAGGLPPQNVTYEEDKRSEKEITKDHLELAEILNPSVDFFYFDVWSSIKEIRCGIEAIKKFNKPYLVGVHISEGNSLPSGEKISEINSIITENCLGVILACVSPENYENNLDEIQKLKVPFGFKLNGFISNKYN